ncbi:MAG: RecQ family ATP-dependent DNA helicase [Phormidium sp.]
MTSSPDWTVVRNTFRQTWGYADFRYPQGEVVQTLLQHHDALVVLPTGGGKSICFQLPALLQRGVTLVVSPLVALMENQVQALRQRHLPAAALHSELSRSQQRTIITALQRQQLRLLYLSPETLFSAKIWPILRQPTLQINGLMLDEAHCLVQWGDTFRPAYRRLGAVRPALLQTRPAGTSIPIAAFTATADPTAQYTIRDVLQLRSPKLFLQNPYRPQLALSVVPTLTPRQRKQKLLNCLKDHPNQSGLVYVRTRKDSEELAQLLQTQGFAVAAYHAGLSPGQRREIERQWLTTQVPVVVCTSAFGMGIDKPDVRWVLHFHAPLLLSEYVQEIGRAGRDGKAAKAITLVSEPTGWLDPTDKQRRQFFEQRERSLQNKAFRLTRQLPRSGSLEGALAVSPEAAIALSLLHSSGQLTWLDPFHYQIHTSKPRPNPTNQQAIEQMQQYLRDRRCRWQVILEAFGFGGSAKACGICDRCLSRTT